MGRQLRCAWFGLPPHRAEGHTHRTPLRQLCDRQVNFGSGLPLRSRPLNAST